MTTPDRPITLREVFRILGRHKKKMIAWCMFVAVGAAGALVVLPKNYSSEARLFVRLGRESVALDPTATTGQTIQVVESRENQVNSAKDLLSSRTLLERVVEKIGPEVVLNGPPGPAPTGLNAIIADLKDRLPSISLSPPVTAKEQAVTKLSKSIQIAAGRNSSVINITVQSKTPALAQQILDAFLEAYHDQYLRVNRVSGSQEFFAEQATLLNQQLDYARTQLRDAKNEAGLVSIPVQQQAVQSQLLQIEANEMAATAALASSQASAERLKSLLVDLPMMISTQQTTGFANAAADSMKQELFKAQMTLKELEAKLGDSHPQLKVAREQMARSEAIVAQQADERAQSTKALNPSYQALDLDLRREEAQTAAQTAKLDKYKTQYAELRERLNELNNQEVLIADLERQADMVEASYRTYAGNLEQARIDQALEANRITNLNVVQPASLVEKPASPKPTIVLAMALVAALGGSLTIALGAEYLDDSLKTTTDVESQLSVPVLATIPRVRGNQVFLQN